MSLIEHVQELHLIPNGIYFDVVITLNKPGLWYVPKLDKRVPGKEYDIHYGIDHELGVIVYGVWYHEPRRRNRKNNGLWRASNYNMHRPMGIRDLIRVTINGYMAHTYLDVVEELLPGGFRIGTIKHGLDHEHRVIYDAKLRFTLN